LNALAAGLESPEASRGKSRSKHQKIKELQQAAETVFRAVDSVPPQDGLFLPQLEALRNKYGPQAFPTAKRPLGAAQGLQRVLLTVELREMRNLPAEKLKAHPAATAFPGAAPAEALRVTRKVQIDTGVPEWHSTGLYAAPGEVIEVVVPKAAAGRKLAVRIGAHKDSLWHLDSWKRCPEVIRKYAMEEPLTRAANAFGGLVYVEVPKGCDLGKIEVEIRNVVEAPHYVLGRTDLAAWRETIRNLPAPWAELETSKVILTVPSEVVRKLEDPEDLMKFWDTVMDCCAELVGKPLDRSHPQRYVSDVQISAGYMHSGYPIMTWLDAAPVMVDKTRLKGDGHGGVWGLWHEMGHNHQSRDWTFDGTGEVTCNLFTLYVMEKACGKAVKDQDRFSPAAWDKRMRSYFTGDRPDFRKWKNDPFLALQMYIQMQQAFGWEAFKTVFAEYRDLPAGQRPRTDDQKRDQWLVRFSKTVGRNLGPFFEAWGVPTSPQARQSVADLPGWMPEGFPPQAAK